MVRFTSQLPAWNPVPLYTDAHQETVAQREITQCIKALFHATQAHIWHVGLQHIIAFSIMSHTVDGWEVFCYLHCTKSNVNKLSFSIHTNKQTRERIMQSGKFVFLSAFFMLKDMQLHLDED